MDEASPSDAAAYILLRSSFSIPKSTFTTSQTFAGSKRTFCSPPKAIPFPSCSFSSLMTLESFPCPNRWLAKKQFFRFPLRSAAKLRPFNWRTDPFWNVASTSMMTQQNCCLGCRRTRTQFIFRRFAFRSKLRFRRLLKPIIIDFSRFRRETDCTATKWKLQQESGTSMNDHIDKFFL